MQLQLSCHGCGKKNSHMFCSKTETKTSSTVISNGVELGISFPSHYIFLNVSMRWQHGSLVETPLLTADSKSDSLKLQLESQIRDSKLPDCTLVMANCICHSLISQDYFFPGLSRLLYQLLQTMH